jgi:hypothetical protein
MGRKGICESMGRAAHPTTARHHFHPLDGNAPCTKIGKAIP